LQIYDGDMSGDEMTRVCGSTRPAAIVSSSNTLTLHMVTDSSIHMEGFDISYTTSSSGQSDSQYGSMTVSMTVWQYGSMTV